MAAPAGSAAPGSRTTSVTAGSTICSSGRPVRSSTSSLVFLVSFRWLGGTSPVPAFDALLPAHSAPRSGRRPSCSTTRRARSARSRLRSHESIDERSADARHRQPVCRRPGMIRASPAPPAAASGFGCSYRPTPTTGHAPPPSSAHHGTLLDAGVRIVDHPAMLHAKAFVRDGEELLAGTCNLEAWSLKRFFEIDLRVRSTISPISSNTVPGASRSDLRRRKAAHRSQGAGEGEIVRGDLAGALSFRLGAVSRS